MKKYWAFFLLIRGNGFIVWHWRQDSQYNFIEWQGARFTPHLIFQIFFCSLHRKITQNEKQPWRDNRFALEENSYPHTFLSSCFYNMVLGFQSLNFSYDMGTNSKDEKLQKSDTKKLQCNTAWQILMAHEYAGASGGNLTTEMNESTYTDESLLYF